MAKLETIRACGDRVWAVPILFAASLALGACGSAAGSPSEAPEETAGRQQMIRDPENPYWWGRTVVEEKERIRVVRDPDNPYWVGNSAPSDPQIDEPTRGPR